MLTRAFGALVAAALSVVTTPAQAPAKTFMWKVTAPGAPPTYLMGSLHVLTPEYYPLAAGVEQAFAASKVLITEADIDEVTNPATMMSLMGKAVLTDGRTLEQTISAPLYRQVIARAEQTGLPRAAIDRMKPWMVALALTGPALQAAGFKAEYGVDKHFSDRAKTLERERRALETVAFQFERMDRMSPADQEALLKSTIDDLDAHSMNVKTMADAWAKGDAAELEKLLLASLKTSADLYKHLLVDRNAAWVPAVERCLNEKTACFVVVGAAHLVGPDSLVAMLQRRGHTVEQQTR
jgi:uncharacterized protein